MTSVLVSPVDFGISDARYGKSYNLLSNLADPEFDIEAYVGTVRTPFTADGVTVVDLDADTKLEYLLESYRAAYERLRDGDVDVYHHMNLGYRWFNPLIVAGLADDVPTLIGPTQTGHEIFQEEFYRLVKSSLGVDIPRWATGATYRAVQQLRSDVIDPPRERLYGRTLRKADKIVAVHEEAKEELSAFVAPSKIDVIPLGVNADDFTFAERARTSDLVSIGALRTRKGYDVLIDALGRVRGDFPDAHLHVFGEGEQREALESRAVRRGVEENVTFHGYVDQSVLQEHLANARAFVHPSRSESFSLVRLEAMATGTPPVVTDTSGAREMVRDGTDGYVVPVEDVDALADRMSRLLGDFDLAKRMGRSARQRVEETYDWRVIGDQYLDAYRELA